MTCAFVQEAAFAAAASLVETLQSEFGSEKAKVVFGALADKRPEEILGSLSTLASEFLFVPVQNARSVAPGELPAMVDVPGRVFDSLDDAMECALQGEGMVLVAGSLYLVGEFLEWAGKRNCSQW